MANKSLRISLWTPPGRLSFPKLASPNTTGLYDIGLYLTDFLITKETFKEKGKPLQQAVLDVGKAYFGETFSFKSKWRTPFKDTDVEGVVKDEKLKGCILFTAKSSYKIIDGKKVGDRPTFIGPRKDSKGKFPDLTGEEIARIKGGDWALLHVNIYAYSEGPGGVTLGLNAVQFWKPGEAFGGDRDTRIFETAAELEAELDDIQSSNVVQAEEELPF